MARLKADTILEITKGIDNEIGNLRWTTVLRIIEKNIEKARRELLRTEASERKTLSFKAGVKNHE
jgi:predicted naringenin-chalcone synthase